jgi:hypothetical protein
MKIKLFTTTLALAVTAVAIAASAASSAVPGQNGRIAVV